MTSPVAEAAACTVLEQAPSGSAAQGAAQRPLKAGDRPQHNGASKRQRIEQQKAELDQGPCLTPHCLLKHTLSLHGALSPGSLSSSKVAIEALADGKCVVYIANASTVHAAHVQLPLQASVETGKEGVLVATPAQGVDVSVLESESMHHAEVQDLQLAGALLGSVDASGQAILRLQADADGSDMQASGQGLWKHLRLEAPPRRECGWAGLSFCPSRSDQATGSSTNGCSFRNTDKLDGIQTAVARHFARDVLLYEGPRLVRTLHTVHAPTAVQYLPQLPCCSSPLLAVAEEHQVSLWDVRAGESGGCVERMGLALGCPLYALEWCGAEGGLLGMAGADRAVTLMEPRKWRPLHKWSTCVKYTIHQMHFSAINPRYVWLGSLDYECLAGRWDGSTGKGTGNTSSMEIGAGRAMGARGMQCGEEDAAPLVQGGLSFRGNSRWLGMARAAGKDVLASVSLTGQMYVWQAAAL